MNARSTRVLILVLLTALTTSQPAISLPGGTVENSPPLVRSFLHTGAPTVPAGALVMFAAIVDDPNGERDLRSIRIVSTEGGDFVFGRIVTSDDLRQVTRPAAAMDGWRIWNPTPNDGSISIEFEFRVPAQPTSYEFRLVAADESTPVVGAQTVVFQVAGPSRLRFTSVPASVTSLESFVLGVEILDELGHRATSASHPITIFRNTGPADGVIAGTRNRAASQGIVEFDDLVIDRAGEYTLLAAAVGLTRATSTTLLVTPGAPDRLSFADVAADVTSGQTTAFVVEIQDAAGNLVPSASNDIQLVLEQGPSGASFGPLRSVAVDGRARFENVAFTHAGSYQLKAESPHLQAAFSRTITVQPVASALAFVDLPLQVVSGEPVSLSVAVLDAQGRRVLASTHRIMLGLAEGPEHGTIAGTTESHAVAGIAAFAGLRFDRGGDYILRATWQGTPLLSSTVRVVPGPASKVEFVRAPQAAVSGAEFTISVRFVDVAGNPVDAPGPSVSLSKAPGSGLGSLRIEGDGTVLGGVTTFPRVSITGTGTYRLLAAAPGFFAAVSGPILVNPTALERVARIEVVPPALDVEAGSVHNLRVTAYDQPVGGNIIDGIVSSFTVGPAGTDVGSVTPQGKFTAYRVGDAHIKVALGQIVHTVAVTVRPGPLARISLTPETASVNATLHANFLALGSDISGNRVPLGDVVWSIDGAGSRTLLEGELFEFPAGLSAGTHTVTASARGVTTSGFVHVTVREADADQRTSLLASSMTRNQGGVETTVYSAGIGAADQNATLALVPSSSSEGALQSAEVRLERPAQNLAVLVETQFGGLHSPPPELDAANLSEVLESLAVTHEPPLFLRITATEGGQPLSATQLNDLLGPMRIRFEVPRSYFEDHGLSSDAVRLIEYSEGRLVSAEITARKVGAVGTSAFLFEADIHEYSTFSIVGAAIALAAPAPDQPGAPGPVWGDKMFLFPGDPVVPRIELRFAPDTTSRYVPYSDVSVFEDPGQARAPAPPEGFDVSRYVRIQLSNKETRIDTAAIDFRLPGDVEVAADRAIIAALEDGTWRALEPVKLVKGTEWIGSAEVKCCAVYALGFDTLAADVTVFVPAGNVSGTVVAGARATDNLGIARVEFYVDGVLLQVRTGEPYVFAINTNLLEPGVHTITAVVFDVAGNEARAEGQIATVLGRSQEAPAMTVDTAAPIRWWILAWPASVAVVVLVFFIIAWKRTREDDEANREVALGTQR